MPLVGLFALQFNTDGFHPLNDFFWLGEGELLMMQMASTEAQIQRNEVALPSLPRQFKHLARMRALDVLPTPRTPVNKNAWATRSRAMAFASVCATWPCPTRSANDCGRYFRARTR